MDYEEPLPETGNGNKYVFVFQDGCTKYPIAIPTKDQTQETTSAAFLRYRWIVLAHGVPFQLISDNGSAFTSELFTTICRKLGCKKVFATPHHPQTVGQVERLNNTILQMLKKRSSEDFSAWDEYLATVLMSYRNTVHLSIQDTPYHALHDRDMNLPIDMLLLPMTDAREPTMAQEIQQKMQKIWAEARRATWRQLNVLPNTTTIASSKAE